MVSGRRVVAIAIALGPSVGAGLLSLVVLFTDPGTGLYGLVPMAGVGICAWLLLRHHPAIAAATVWRFSSLAFACVALGNAVALFAWDVGIYAPSGQASPSLVVTLWLVSLAFSYRVVLADAGTSPTPD